MKKLLALLLILTLVSSQALAEKDREEELEELLAETYMASGQYDKAMKGYRDILEKEPDNIKARTSLADVLSWIKKYDESISEYKKVLEIDPDNLTVQKKLAEVYTWKGDLEQAEELYRKIIKERPADREIYSKLGELLTWRREYPEALRYFSLAMKGGKPGKERFLYGQALLYSGQYDLAEAVFKEILQEHPDDLEAKTLLADTYAYSKRFEKGIKLYKEVLEKKDDLKVKEKLADTLSWDKRYKRSFDMYDEILKERKDARISRQKARVLGWARDYDASLNQYKKTLEMEDDENIRLEMEGKKAYWNNRVDTAIDDYTELIRREPDNVEAMFDLSQIYSYQSMWKNAIDEYHSILDIIPTHFRAREGLEKAELIAKHVSYRGGYERFESDSVSRENDIRRHTFFNEVTIPVNYKFDVELDYMLTGRIFHDFPDLLENKGRVKLTYLNNPDWWINGYYGLMGYNKSVDELNHLFGGIFSHRVFDIGAFTFSYDRDPLENISMVIREHYYKNDFKWRLDVDVNKRLKLGADYLFSYYKFNNKENRPGFDASYYFSLEPMMFLFKYRYFYRQFENKVGVYFSPKGFSTSMFTINWRHYLNKEEIFFGADDLYYDLKYEVTLDSQDIVGNKFTWQLNWDLHKKLNFNVKGSFQYSSANVYRESDFTIGLKYYF